MSHSFRDFRFDFSGLGSAKKTVGECTICEAVKELSAEPHKVIDKWYTLEKDVGKKLTSVLLFLLFISLIYSSFFKRFLLNIFFGVCCDYANCLESDCRTYQNSLLLCD
jgi:hypothetical protein